MRKLAQMFVLFVCLASTYSALAVGSLNLAWDPSPATNLSGYIVRYATTSGQYTMSTNVGNRTTATVGGLQDGVTYYFVVTAINTFGLESDPSNEVGSTVPPAGAPIISPIANQTTTENLLVTVPFTVSSASTPVSSLALSASSSNTGLLPLANIVFGGVGSNRNVVLTPWPGRSGTANVVVTVNDGTATASRGFTLTVNGINDPPTLASLADRTISEDAATQSVTLSGIGTGDTNELQSLAVTATSSNPSLIPTPTVSYTSPNATGTLTFRPSANATGVATISVTVNDGQLLNNLVTRAFNVTVSSVNDAPTISAIADQSITRDTSSGAISFLIGDLETTAGSLTLSANSSNPTLLPISGIIFSGSGANRTVTLAPATGQTGSASVTVTVGDGSATASDTFVVTVNPPGVGPTSFTNQTSIAIADVGAGTPYPSPITVSGLGGTISQVTLTLKNINHAFPDDIDVLLVSPAGQKVMVLSDAGGANGINGVTMTLSDAASSSVTDEGILASGTYRPTDIAPGEARDLFPAPAPAGPYAASLATFNGQSPNGTWSLYVNDDGAGDQGAISGGWTLTITTTTPANSAPTISDIAAQSTSANTPTAAVPFTVSDAETPAASLTLSGTSSNPSLVPNGSIAFGGSGNNRTVTVTPAAGQSGTANITITVIDASGGAANDTFSLFVAAPNSPPTISDIGSQSTPANTPTGQIPFAINDAETAAGNLVLSGASSNPTLVPNANIVFGGSGSNRTVTITPAFGQSGTATIGIYVTDAAGGSVSDSFALMVTAPNPPPTVALTSPTNGGSYAAPANVTLAASVNANGYTITKVQFYNGSTLLGEDATAPFSFSWGGVNSGSYSVSARVIYGTGSFADSALIPFTVTGLPAPWQAVDIGSVGTAGSASASGGVFAVNGAGNISGTSDNFRFVYQPLSGDGEIKIKLSSVANTGTGGRVGVMIRESLTSGSRYAFMGISPDGTFRWQRRSSTSGSTSSTTSTTGTLPDIWVRLVRTGSTLYGYRSADGVTWTKVSSRSISMAANIHVGLAVASGSSTTLNAASFGNVTVAP